jgi:undecaprenyl-diphosphatase
MDNAIKTWGQNFTGFFKLISERKIAETHSLLPKMAVFFPTISLFIVVIVATYFILDPLYMDWFKVNDTDNPDSIFSKTTDLAQVHWFLVPTGLSLILISIWKLKPVDKSDLLKWHHRFMGVYFIFTAIVFSGLLTLLFKNVFGRVRPNYYDGTNLWQSVPFGGEYAFLSFPSGHATTAGAVAMIVLLFAPRFGLFGILFALWIAVSRLFVGAHYPSDVVAGLMVGAVFTWIYARSFARKRMLFKFIDKGGLAFRKPNGSR